MGNIENNAKHIQLATPAISDAVNGTFGLFGYPDLLIEIHNCYITRIVKIRRYDVDKRGSHFTVLVCVTVEERHLGVFAHHLVARHLNVDHSLNS